MAILNATPDSFSDGGALSDAEAVERRVREVVRQGADLLDIGGESTRPGHVPVAASEEWARVRPVLEAARRLAPGVPISIDTQKPEVAARALAAGAHWINDVGGLADPGLARVAGQAGCGLVLMRREPLAGAAVEACGRQVDALLARARALGLEDGALILDPGLGFGDPPGADPDANVALIDAIPLWSRGHPVLVGASRKRFVGAWADEPDPRRRGAASARLAVRAAHAGAAIVRVHDVDLTVQTLRAADRAASVRVR